MIRDLPLKYDDGYPCIDYGKASSTGIASTYMTKSELEQALKSATLKNDAPAKACPLPGAGGLGFDSAVKWLKQGFKLQRAGWNGKGQYIQLGRFISYADPDGNILNANHVDMGSAAIVFHGTSGEQVGWLASQSDILAEDWAVVR